MVSYLSFSNSSFIDCLSFIVPSIRASTVVARAFISALAATALFIPTLSVRAIGLVLAVVITVIFTIIELLLRVVIAVKLLYLMRVNSGVNYRS
jgi:hypothetical protein